MSEVEKEHRLERLEIGLRDTRDSVLLMGKDIHMMNTSISSIAKSMGALVDIQSNLKVIEERTDSRHNQNKIDLHTIHSRIDKVAGNQAKVAWTVFTAVILGVMSLLLVK